MVAVAENTADELARSDGREVQLEEDPDLQLPFLLPEDGYSCDVVRNIPNGFQEFLDPLCQRGKRWTEFLLFPNIPEHQSRSVHGNRDAGGTCLLSADV